MPKSYKKSDDIKRKLREIKKFEIKIRSDKSNSHNNDLVWNKFFHLKSSINKHAKYSLEDLSFMTKDEFAAIIEEYFYHVYYRYYKERGMADDSFIDVDILSNLGLPMDSDYDDVIRSFRDHIKAYHPDNGGDVGKFLEIMDSYNNFRTER